MDREPQSTQPSLASLIGKAAHAISEQLSNGDVAELRRAGPESPFSPALWKLLVMLDITSSSGVDEAQDAYERRWSVIFNGMAITAGLHSMESPLGSALANAGFSELRLVRLLEARGDALHDAVRHMAQFLASKATPTNWIDVARLVLSTHSETRESIRRSIARHYYRTLHRNTTENEA